MLFVRANILHESPQEVVWWMEMARKELGDSAHVFNEGHHLNENFRVGTGAYNGRKVDPNFRLIKLTPVLSLIADWFRAHTSSIGM